jgi:hypothetical protein
MRLNSCQPGLRKGLDPTHWIGYDGYYNWIEQIPDATGECCKHSPAANPANWKGQLTGLVSLYHRLLWLLKDNQSAAPACVAGAALLFWSVQFRVGCSATLPALVVANDPTQGSCPLK